MKVVIDHREPEIFRTLFSEEDIVSVETLDRGDFLINGQWIFERKTISDLCASLVDGRLFKQALQLMQSEAHPVVILEGSSRDMESSGVRRESVQGALITLSVFFGLPVLRSLDPQETVQLMRYTAGQGSRLAEGGVQRFGYRPKGKKARQLFVLQGLPNIGRKRAEALLSRFGSIEAVMSADEDELAGVEGIGDSIAEKIRNLVNESGVSYAIRKKR
jgi:ERCC4-type nuclease